MAKAATYSFIVDGMKRAHEESLRRAILTVPGINKAVVDSNASSINIIADKRSKRIYKKHIKSAIDALELRDVHIRTEL